MARRSLIAALWFASTYVAGEVIWSVAATPRALNVLVALGAAAFMFLDPLSLVHPQANRPSAHQPAAQPIGSDPHLAAR
jgi:hypothetical protein